MTIKAGISGDSPEQARSTYLLGSRAQGACPTCGSRSCDGACVNSGGPQAAMVGLP